MRAQPLPQILPSLLLPALLAAAGTVHAQAARYALDPVHTRVVFAVNHAGFSSAVGTISGSTGELWFDPEDWSSARLSARIPIARADLGDAKWNQAALARNLLDAPRHPQAAFVSTRVEPRDANHAAVFGMLTLRGVSTEVKLEVTLNAAKRHPLPPFRRTAGFSATTTLSRRAFGIDAWPSVIGDAVELRIEAEAIRARSGGPRLVPGPDAPPPAKVAPTDIPATEPLLDEPRAPNPQAPEPPAIEPPTTEPAPTPAAPMPKPPPPGATANMATSGSEPAP